MTNAWHFTSAQHWPVIKADGELRRTESNLDMLRRHAGPDVVWLIDSPDLGSHGHGLAFADRATAVDKTEVRIEVEANPKWTKRWIDFARAQGISDEWFQTLVRVGGGMEAAERWLVSFAKIPSAAWVRADNVKTGEELWTP